MSGDEPEGDETRAVFRDGVLYDPMAMAVARAVERHNSLLGLRAGPGHLGHRDAIERFLRRALERMILPADTLIVVLNVDDPIGGALAEVLMPGHDWDAIRATGDVPYARGIVERAGFQRC